MTDTRPSSREIINAFKAGGIGYRDNTDRRTKLYPPGPLHDAWLDGWDDAEEIHDEEPQEWSK